MGRDNPDPALILQSSRQRKPVTDPTNGEPVVTAMETLVTRIDQLSRALPKTVALGTRDDQIYHAMHRIHGPDDTDGPSTFNRRMDFLFGEDCRNSDGRLHHVRRGANGMTLIVKYLEKVEWSAMICDIATIKLNRIIVELEFLCTGTAASIPESSKSKRKSPDESAVDDGPQVKRIRSTNDGKVTIEEVDGEDDAGDDAFSPDDGSSSSDNEDEVSSNEAGPSKSPVLGPSGKASRTTKHADRRRRSKKVPQSTSDPTEVDADGMLVDVDVQEIQPPKDISPGADINHFCGKPFLKKGKAGADKLHRKCKICKKETVSDTSTVRRHLQKYHKPQYNSWADKNGFESRLPDDVKARADAAAAAASAKAKLTQRTLDKDLKKRPDRPAPYTDELFTEAALEWLIATDQPIEALTNPYFKNMIDIAARATEGVNLPNRAQTRDQIKQLFYDQMNKLKIRLHSDAVTGLIHITCDAWQADNTDGYLAVTGHWMEESSPGVWELREGLLGFTRLNNAHHGVRLGQALYKIIARLGIQERLGYVTCDNAQNNGTMLFELERVLLRETGVKWDPIERRINCLAHVINLATQKLISTYSKAAHFDTHKPSDHIPDTSRSATELRDEIGILRAIAVKERSSAKRKELFRSIQLRKRADPAEAARQMILDMKIRWSSTYSMLDRGYQLKESVDTFIFEIAYDEKDREKREKLTDLQLTEDEWSRIDLFLNVLQSAQNAQHAFSSDLRSTLHLAIPALERLHAEWTAKSEQLKYSVFHVALAEALLKVDEYYQKTSNSNSYMFAMVLDPRKKLSYFEKHWPKSLQSAANENMEQTFKQRYNRIHADAAPTSTKSKTSAAPSRARRAVTPIDEDEEMADLSTSHIDPLRPWLDEFRGYLAAREAVPDGMTTIEWWGRNQHRYPIWASLARDYLAIMASSVSSERAFSSAGITISKRRNRLKGDIVEALQVLKCMIRRDLLFRLPEVMVDDDTEPEFETEAEKEEKTDPEKGGTWDFFIDDDPDNYELDVFVDDS